MATAGQEALTTIDGLKVAMKTGTQWHPDQDQRMATISWLEDNGYAAIVKREVEAAGFVFDSESAVLANPADAFRLFNLSASQATAAASGLGAAAKTVPVLATLTSLAIWPFLAFGLAWLGFRRVQP